MGLSRHAPEAEIDADMERVWRDYWLPLLIKDGDVDLEQVKKELYDYHNVLEVVPSVYSHASGGAMSKPSYNDVQQICAVIDDHYDEVARENAVDALKTALGEALFGDKLNEVFDSNVLVREYIEAVCRQLNIDPKLVLDDQPPSP
jgi:hypothetical protein